MGSPSPATLTRLPRSHQVMRVSRAVPEQTGSVATDKRLDRLGEPADHPGECLTDLGEDPGKVPQSSPGQAVTRRTRAHRRADAEAGRVGGADQDDQLHDLLELVPLFSRPPAPGESPPVVRILGTASRWPGPCGRTVRIRPERRLRAGPERGPGRRRGIPTVRRHTVMGLTEADWLAEASRVYRYSSLSRRS